MARRRRVRPRLGMLLLLLVALLIWLWFEGVLPLPGDRPADGDPGAKPAPVAGSGSPLERPRAPAPSDVVAGRRERLAYLIRTGKIAEALVLARAMAEQGADENERELGRRHLAMDGRIRFALETGVRRAVDAGRVGDAEQIFEKLRDAFPEVASTMVGPGLDTLSSDAVAALGGLIEGAALDGGRTVWKAREREVVLRVPGEGGGFRYETVAISEIGPLQLRAAVRRRAAGDAAAAEALSTLASLYAAAGKPVSACLARTGTLSPPSPDRGPGAAGTRR